MSLDEELMALAEAAATTLVTSMATDLWQGTRQAAVEVFQRLGRRRRTAVAEQLDRNAALVQAAGRPEEIRQALFGFWSLELAALLSQDPDARGPLTRLAAATTARPDTRRPLIAEQTNTARDGGTVFAVQHGDQRVHRCAAQEGAAEY